MKKKNKLKKLFIISMITIGIIISYKRVESSKIKISNKDFTDLIINNTYTYKDENIVLKTINTVINKNNPIKLMNTDYKKYLSNTTEPVITEETLPLIYLYNSHQTEEYKASNYAEFSVNPTIIMNDYILEDIFNKNGYKTIVEERSIKEILNKNNWNYTYSYKASRQLLEESIIKYPSLKYFIDIHRDSLPHDKTIVSINGKDYAKVIFLIGLENENYQKNLEFTEKINNKMNEL